MAHDQTPGNTPVPYCAIRRRALSSIAPALLWIAGCVGQIPVEGEAPAAPGREPGVDGGRSPTGANREAGTSAPGAPSGTGGEPARPGAADRPGEPVRFARLTHFEYDQSVRDLLGLAADRSVSEAFIRDAVSGFDRHLGATTDLTAELRLDYERAAETLAAELVADPKRLAALAPAVGSTQARVRELVTGFGRRAYRRPLTTAEIDELIALHAKGAAAAGAGDPFAEGARLVVSLVLQSPHFLYRTKLGAADGAGRLVLSGHEVATELAYALTGAPPDVELSAEADAGRLATAEQRRKQAMRLVQTPAAARLWQHFHDQLFEVAAYENVAKDATAFPGFVPATMADARREVRWLTTETLREGRGLADLLTTPRAFVTARLAKLYGVAGTFDDVGRAVELDPGTRPGVLTRIGPLASTAERRITNPIRRGAFVARAVLCRPLPPAIADVPPLPETGGNTTRERVERHTGKGTCGEACHAVMNPLGFAFEGYDAAGVLRAKEDGFPIDASGTYDLDGRPIAFRGAKDLLDAAASSTEAHRCYARSWLSYVRGSTAVDERALDTFAGLSTRGIPMRDVLAEMALEGVRP